MTTEQSNRSSSSRFSAASLRGLTGHQTAPAREIPKTQENAMGSFAEMTATLSPGDRSRATRAAATAYERSTTAAYVSDSPSVVRHGRSAPRDAPLSR